MSEWIDPLDTDAPDKGASTCASAGAAGADAGAGAGTGAGAPAHGRRSQIALLSQVGPKFGQVRPHLARSIWHFGPEMAHLWPNLIQLAYLGPKLAYLGPNLAPTWLRNRSQKAPEDLKIWRANIVTENDCIFDLKIIAFCDEFLRVL